MKSMTSRKLRTLITLTALLAALAVFPVSIFAAADDYPNKPVRLIIPWPPGGSNDFVGRPIAAKLSEQLGKQVVVDNRGGAGGIIGTEAGAKADPDGYTLTMTGAAYTLYAPLHDNLPFDPLKSFTPIARLGSGPNVLVVHPSLPVKSVKELIAQAKQKPGQLIFVSVGAGASLHMGTELFKIMADIDFKIVQFKGGGPAMTDLLGGHSQAFICSLIAALPHIKSGKLRALGTGGKMRSAVLPDVPTIEEAGVPGYETSNWWGILAPAGTPAPIVTKLNNEIKAILATDDVKKGFLKYGIEVDHLGPAEFGEFIEKETANWTRVVKKANIRLEK
ncbi:MAG: tripartite tricarboxylate transporter substrate binding protein [Proteobacteria bacterium]|nr:tripartite tricarboxylate transporter substrate binding protein [Pseudomonadota bacterium]MBU2228149.1 tripartite tricarboxylate transporter substrate binding protein [Pseudomonadota bacterium]MBU2262470.1 tripartite tricarboxylate transporter substrate binding protein [Pseudomonadota bacterium]